MSLRVWAIRWSKFWDILIQGQKVELINIQKKKYVFVYNKKIKVNRNPKINTKIIYVGLCSNLK